MEHRGQSEGLNNGQANDMQLIYLQTGTGRRQVHFIFSFQSERT